MHLSRSFVALAGLGLGLAGMSQAQVPLGTLTVPAGDVIIAEDDFGISTIDPILVPLSGTGFATGGSVLASDTVVNLTEAATRSLGPVDLTGFTDVDFFFSWATTGTFTDGSAFNIVATAESTDFTLFSIADAGTLGGAGGPPFFEFFASPPAGATDAGLDTLLASGLDLSSVTFTSEAVSGPGSDGTIFLDSILITGTPVPEPAAATLLGLGGALLAARRRKA
ncbi:MAG: PEP-CTERM sorting domain-containing protein [Planctomycetota bacterium]